MTALEILLSLLEDPHHDGDYVLYVTGEDLRRLWRAVEEVEARANERYVPMG